jgi:hypothetical protein
MTPSFLPSFLPSLSPMGGHFCSVAGPPSKVVVAGGLSMAKVNVESSNIFPAALIRCGPLCEADL